MYMSPKQFPIARALATAAVALTALCGTAGTQAFADDACVAQPALMQNPIPMPDPAKFPDNPSNCDFHQWTWQMFLWLMEPVNGAPRFESFADPKSLDPGRTAGPSAGALLPGLALTGDKAMDIYLQAGPDGILVDQNGRIVYYSMYIDKVFSDFFKENDLTTSQNMLKLDPNTPFPEGTLSLKAAWKIVGPNDKTDGFYTKKAVVNLLTKKGGKFVIDPTKTEEVKVAMVGFHIAGTVAHHAEMIWSTFEHDLNAPDVANYPNVTPDQVVSDKDWTFYKAGTPFKGCNVNPAGSPEQTLDVATQKMSPVTQACRLYAYGSGPDKASNAANIQSLNASVIAGINDGKIAADKLWTNYFELGSTWFDTNAGKPIQPNCNFQPGEDRCGVVVTGSTHLSNTTIETFTQAQSSIDSCFSCHHTTQRFPPAANLNPLPGKDANISHIFNNLYFSLQQQGK